MNNLISNNIDYIRSKGKLVFDKFKFSKFESF